MQTFLYYFFQSFRILRDKYNIDQMLQNILDKISLTFEHNNFPPTFQSTE